MARLRRALGAAMAIGLIAAVSASHPTVDAARAPFVAVWEP